MICNLCFMIGNFASVKYFCNELITHIIVLNCQLDKLHHSNIKNYSVASKICHLWSHQKADENVLISEFLNIYYFSPSSTTLLSSKREEKNVEIFFLSVPHSKEMWWSHRKLTTSTKEENGEKKTFPYQQTRVYANFL